MENRGRYTFFLQLTISVFTIGRLHLYGVMHLQRREKETNRVLVWVCLIRCVWACVCVGNSKEQSGQGKGHVLFVFNSCQAAAELQYRLRFRRGQTRQAAQGAGQRCLCPSTPCSPSTTPLLCLIGYLSCSGGTGDFITLISSNATSSSWAKGNKCPWN